MIILVVKENISVLCVDSFLFIPFFLSLLFSFNLFLMGLRWSTSNCGGAAVLVFFLVMPVDDPYRHLIETAVEGGVSDRYVGNSFT